ncbi:hypothetical protein [Streptomyces rimosus]|uniref:hypothetical protein n=1 Tax=Streptomyces rimosus TaxID=1927 RepID=UPI0004C550B8|nr:hypothetical protein [Streptomyces rimosus]
MQNGKFLSGRTAPGEGWQDYPDRNGNGVYIDVDTSEGGFTDTPAYIAALTGDDRMWMTTGGNTVYNATPTGFRVYVRRVDRQHIDPAYAAKNGWHIAWIAAEV